MLWSGDLVTNEFHSAIGNKWTEDNEQFSGYIDEVRIWNTARTAAELSQFKFDLPNPTAQEGLLAYYKFDGTLNNSQGNSAYDGMQVGNDGILQENPVSSSQFLPHCPPVPYISIDNLLANGESPWLVVIEEGQTAETEIHFSNPSDVTIDYIDWIWSLGSVSGTVTWNGILDPGQSSMLLISDIPFENLSSGSLDSLVISASQVNLSDVVTEESMWTYIAINPEEPHHCVSIPRFAQSHIEIPHDPLFELSEDFTIETWFKIDSLQNQTIYQKSLCTSGDKGFHLTLYGNQLSYNWFRPSDNCDNDNWYLCDQEIETSRWYHIAIVHRADSIIAYLNGEHAHGSLVEGAFGPADTNQEPLRLGAYKALDGTIEGFLNGELDEFRIWNTERSIESISNWMATSTDIGLEADLIAHYRFCPNDSSLVYDDINGLHGLMLDSCSFEASSSPVLDIDCPVDSTISELGQHEMLESMVIVSQTDENILIRNTSSEPLRCLIYDVRGSLVFKSLPLRSYGELDIPRPNPGLYLIRLFRGNESTTIKLIVD